MNVDKGIPVRLVLYLVAIAYLVLDLFVIGGPVRRAVFRQRPDSPEVIAAAKREGVAARVFFQPILLTQVDRRVEEELWKQGRTLEDLGPGEHKFLRLAAVNDLVDLHLLRTKVRYNSNDYPVGEQDIEDELERFAKRFGNDNEFAAALKNRGWSKKELRMRLAARLQQQKYLEGVIEVAVSEEEAGTWFDQHKAELAVPERVRARHVFLATLERDPEEARQTLHDARRAIRDGEKSFDEAAREISDDPRTRSRGGDLGWLRAERLDPVLAEVLFEAEPGTLNLVRTDIGWHLCEVLEKRAPRERSFEEARQEVLAALEAVKRDRGLRLYRSQLREREAHRVEIFHDVLARGLK